VRYWKTMAVPGKPVVGVAVAAYLPDLRQLAALRCLVASLQAQTYGRWRCLVVHDGPCEEGLRAEARRLAEDKRVTFQETEKRVKQFGHPHRQKAIDHLLEAGCSWLGLTNGDNYYCPVYFEWMLSRALRTRSLFAYCDMVHSHKLWSPFKTEPRYRKLDLGAWLAAAEVVRKVKFNKSDFAADGDYINRLVEASQRRVVKVGATLYTHN
jgi:hypothetical protein